MKIAVSGSHKTGKSTLIGELSDRLPGFELFDEPYWQLVEEGQLFSDPPTLEEYELQLERSVDDVVISEGDCLFERCPLDFLAYILVLDDSLRSDVERHLPSVREAVESLDLIVFVPIEEPDRMGDTDYPELRRRVDEELREIVMDDVFDLGIEVLEVTGPAGERARQVMELLGRKRDTDEHG